MKKLIVESYFFKNRKEEFQKPLLSAFYIGQQQQRHDIFTAVRVKQKLRTLFLRTMSCLYISFLAILF